MEKTINVEDVINETVEYVISNSINFTGTGDLDEYYRKQYEERIDHSPETGIDYLFCEFQIKCNAGISARYNEMKKTEDLSVIKKDELVKVEPKEEKKGFINKVKNVGKKFTSTFDEIKEDIMHEAIAGVLPKLKAFVPKIRTEIISFMEGKEGNDEKIIIIKLEKNKDVSMSIFKKKNMDIELKSTLPEGSSDDDINADMRSAFQGRYTLEEGIELMLKYASMSDKEKKELINKFKQ